MEAFQDVGEEAWADRLHRFPQEQDEDEEAFQVGDEEAFRDEGEEAWTESWASLLLRHSPQQGQVEDEAFPDQDAVWEPCLDEEHQDVEAFQDEEAFRDEGEEAWTGRLGPLLRHSPQQGQDVGAEAFLDQDAVWEPCLDEEHRDVEAFQDVGEEAWADRLHRSLQEQDEDEEAFLDQV